MNIEKRATNTRAQPLTINEKLHHSRSVLSVPMDILLIFYSLDNFIESYKKINTIIKYWVKSLIAVALSVYVVAVVNIQHSNW